MDIRRALEQGTWLHLGSIYQKHGDYRIHREIGRGGTGIVYEASYQNNAGTENIVRIKECYPQVLQLKRKGSALIADPGEEEAFARAKARMREAFHKSSDLFKVDGLTNKIANTLDIYEGNHTVYIVSTYLQGQTLEDAMERPLKDIIDIMASVARAVEGVHSRGYLYLDIKPDNIFVFEETARLVQLFDFDSLIPIDKNQRLTLSSDVCLACTKGFSPPEQIEGRLDGVAPYSDIFSIGATLFYMVFNRPPTALDCSLNTEFDYGQWRFRENTYNDKLYPLMTEFFRHTLASYPKDRYKNMSEVVAALAKMSVYGDISLLYVHSSRINESGVLFGREGELHFLEQWFCSERPAPLFLTGMGGIGKSTLVRHFLKQHRAEFDSLLYVYAQGSITKLVGDDRQIQVNTMEKAPEESTEDYFYRKLGALKKLARDTSMVLVIDNFDGEIDESFLAVADAGWKLLVITRNERLAKGWQCLSLGALEDAGHLRTLFEYYLGRDICDAEECSVHEIIQYVQGHTLALEFVAKQAARSYLTLGQAAYLAKSRGFSHIAKDKVDYQKDALTKTQTIRNIIYALFPVGEVALEKQTVLKILSLFPMPGVDAQSFFSMTALKTKDALNALKDSGWVNTDGDLIYLHPIIGETVQRLEWTREALGAVCHLMDALRRRLKEPWRMAWAESVLKGCGYIKEIRETRQYLELLCKMVLCISRDREDFITNFGSRLLARKDFRSLRQRAAVYDLLVYIYSEQGDFPKARRLLMQVSEVAAKAKSHDFWARYYDMLGDYYDVRLGGCYDEGMANRDFVRLLHACNKAIEHMEQSETKNRPYYLIKYYISKVGLLIRTYPTKAKTKIEHLLTMVEMLEADVPGHYPDLGISYFMLRAWYYALVNPNEEWAMAFIEKARAFACDMDSDGCLVLKETQVSELAFIDQFIIPAADICSVLNQCEGAKHWLYVGIDLCEKHEDELPFIRKQRDLLRYLLDVYCQWQCWDDCRVVVSVIDSMNDVWKGVLETVEIPSEIREFLYKE